MLASGGVGHLYSTTTNPGEANGHGLAMAARAGALISDAEFVQFHPTALDVDQDPAPLASEAIRVMVRCWSTKTAAGLWRVCTLIWSWHHVILSPVLSIARLLRGAERSLIAVRQLVQASLNTSPVFLQLARMLALIRSTVSFLWPRRRITIWAVC